MYAWIWRHLPGPWPVRTLLSLVLLAATVAVLFTVVFPWAEQALPFTRVTVH
ncbi:hypothetical protein EV189_0480 [Motilibacter rhizosphaerae]|uniref:Uncharacterized protein n=1 Tax=Motilibacter rhizosphaerae TaxID=598652 RepID=A0A4Q7NVS0_9ACTN|nr:hypothetical protein [Motilibacter rhizosphaerae]RZS91244.1 hypothetical protein EV189_0480 [Motilibacter rhizosphaerae]